MRTALSVLTCVLYAACVAVSVPAAEEKAWDRFRGPNGSGYSQTQFPTMWKTEDYRWQVKLAGEGHSSPVARDGRAAVTSTDGKGQLIVQCLNVADGAELWRRALAIVPLKQHNFNSAAASTPAIDDRRIYVTTAGSESYLVVALDAQTGAEVWRRDLGPFTGDHGFGASPVLCDGQLIVPNDQDGESFTVALDAASGAVRWKTPRQPRKVNFSTPAVLAPPDGGKLVILSSWGQGLTALDAASGKPRWERQVFQNRSVGSPLVVGQSVVAAVGEGGGGKKAVILRAATPEAEDAVVELKGSLPYVPTPVSDGKSLFLLADSGVASLYDLATGEPRWRERIGGKFFSSPLWLGGRLYCVSREGEVVVLATGEKFERLGTVELGEPTHATPAVAGDLLLLRTQGRLFALPKVK